MALSNSQSLRLQLLLVILVMGIPCMASAQSLGVGFGLGLPFMKYITGETDREYRVVPEPGYYPVLKDYENAFGSLHFHASLLLDFDLPFDVEARFDAALLSWDKTKVTHVTCTPVDMVNGSFNDANAEYIELSKVSSECLNRETYNAEKDISDLDISSLWLLHLAGGARYSFFSNADWRIYAGAHLGLTIATMADKDTWFGGNIDVILGLMYRLSELIWIEFDTKLEFMVTQVPQDSQVRINHETSTGGNIFTSLVQPNAYLDFQFSIRFDFSDL